MGAPREDASYSLQGMSVMAPVSTIVGGIHFELFLARAAEMANFSWPMTDEEYLADIEEEKYSWRSSCEYQAEKYNLNVTDFETEEAFSAALEEAKARQVAKIAAQAPKVMPRSRAGMPSRDDPLAETDKTVYTFCGIIFPNCRTVYHYLTDDETLNVGDMVVIPVGNKGDEKVCEVATIEKHRRKTAPYPVDQAKHIKGRYTDEQENFFGLLQEAAPEAPENGHEG